MEILAFRPEHEAAVLELSLRAWAPVFERLQPAVPAFVFEAFYPDGWAARQTAEIRDFLNQEGDRTYVAALDGSVVGWMGLRLHPEDRMGEIYILAVDPGHQRKGVAGALMDHATTVMLQAGMAMIMVETGDDPGHAASRAAYESAGFQRWPVARYFRPLRLTSSTG